MKTIALTKGYTATVDDEYFDGLVGLNWQAAKSRRGVIYATRTRNQYDPPGPKTIRMHREIVNAPDGIEVDHIDGDGLNNRIYNLRLATDPQNAMNRHKRTDTSSKYKGVNWRHKDKRWNARICINYKSFYLGNFRTEEDAARAYDVAAREKFGEFARTNFPSED